jgi:GTPase SAR1 family protein
MTDKMLFVGLDNGGKTTIIYTLNKHLSLRGAIRPTIGVSRNEQTNLKLLGMKIAQWDLGGQKKYREKYISSQEKYVIFADTLLMLYVIDAQDIDRYDEAVEYLLQVLNIYRELNQKPVINVLFNKVDPDKKNNKELLQEIEALKEKIEKIKEDFDIEYYKTSVHEEITLIQAFSNGVMKVSKKSKMITDMLKDFTKETFSSVILLLDENGFIMGSHSSVKNESYLDLCQTIAARFTLSMEKLEEYKIETDNLILNIKFKDPTLNDEEKTAFVFLKYFYIDESTIAYIVTFAKNDKTLPLSLKYLPELANKLRAIMMNFSTESTI